MAWMLRDCYLEYRSRFELELAAGESGLDRAVKWVYVAEDYTTSDFLRGGELIVTTGVISGGDPQWLMEFLQHMTAQHTSGLILNLGPYLQREILTPEILAFCEQHRYPLFVMPWHIHIYDITRCFYDRIFLDTRRSEELDAAFFRLLEHPDGTQSALSVLASAGFPEEAPYYVTAFSVSADRSVVLSENRALMDELSVTLLRQSIPAHPAVRRNDVFLIAQSTSAHDIQPIVRTLTDLIGQRTAGSCSAGIGSRADGLANLYQSRRHALDTLRLGCARGQSLTCYDDTGFFRMLMNVSDKEMLRQYVQTALVPVHEYDRIHRSDLSRTLYLYLLHRGSVQAVAEQAFCHRNTINHRIRILKETLGYQLDDSAVCFELMSAFLTEEYLQSQ